MGASAFNESHSLYRAIVPAADMGNLAFFKYCSHLIFGAIGKASGGFYYSTGLRDVVVSGGTSITDTMFSGCSALQKIVFPGTITYIGTSSFKECYGVKIFDFSACNSVPTLAGTGAFNSTSATKQIVVPDALYEDWKVATNWSSDTNGIVNSIVKASAYVNGGQS